MKILLRSGNATTEIRDIVGEYGIWEPGVARDVPDDATLTFIGRYPEGDRREARNAVEAILSCGPNFIDADLGFNPHYACSKCVAETTADFFGDPKTGLPVPYQTADGKRLCIACFLDAHPERVKMHEFAGFRRPEASAPAPAIAAPAPEPAPIVVAPDNHFSAYGDHE